MPELQLNITNENLLLEQNLNLSTTMMTEQTVSNYTQVAFMLLLHIQKNQICVSKFIECILILGLILV